MINKRGAFQKNKTLFISVLTLLSLAIVFWVLAAPEFPSPSEGANISGSSVLLNCTFNDSLADIVNVSFHYSYLNGSNDSTLIATDFNGTQPDTQFNITWDTTSGVPDGPYELSCIATNSTGGTDDELRNVTVDNNAPSVTGITVNGIGNGANLTSGTYVLNVSVIDTGTGVENVMFNLSKAGVTNTTYGTIRDGNYSTNSSFNTSGFADGKYNLTVQSSDYLGNNNNSEYITITLDSGAPTISIISSGDPSTSEATITWTTDELANSSVNYGTSTGLGSVSSSTSVVTSHSITLTSLTAETTYYYNVSSCDPAGNCNTTGPNSFSTDAEPTTTTTTVTSSLPPISRPPAQPTKSQKWDTLKPGATVMKIDKPELGFKQITISLKNTVTNVEITVTKLADKPATITKEISTGKVYQYLEIKKSSIKDDDISSTLIEFKVEKEWLINNSFDENTVKLNKYVDDDWVELSTIKKSSDDTYVYYEVRSSGFSVFAISASAAAAPPPEEEEVVEEEVVEEAPEEEVVEEEVVEEAPEEEVVEEKRLGAGAIISIIVLILIVVVLFYFSIQRKKAK